MELTKLTKLKTNPRNPRTITDAQFERLKDSLLVFPKMLTLRPLATDGNGIVLGGNMRLRALKDIAKMTAEQIAERLQGMKTYNQKNEAEQTALVEYWRDWLTRKDVPTTHESTLTDAEKDEFVMTDNVSFGSWDFDAIANEWDAELVEEWGVDVWQDVMAEDEENDNNYSRKIEAPDYEPTGRNVQVSELYDESKTQRLIAEINAMKVNAEIKKMLVAGAQRFTRFDFRNVAEWYSQQEDESVKAMMRKMAMVIVDFDEAVENGFVRLCEELIKEYEDEQSGTE